MLKLLGKKIGMSHIYKSNGKSTALTILQLYDNKIIECSDESNLSRISIAFMKAEKTKNINKSIIGFFNKKQYSVYKKIKSSKIKLGHSFNLGDAIDYSSIFKEGDLISIRGTSSGKGFAGVMKRWNFRGLEASHGVSVSHRSHGSTGQRQDPGKTFKGKKMAGHLGNENVTIKNLCIEYIDIKNSLIGVSGSVPGRNGSEVVIKLNKF